MVYEIFGQIKKFFSCGMYLAMATTVIVAIYYIVFWPQNIFAKIIGAFFVGIVALVGSWLPWSIVVGVISSIVYAIQCIISLATNNK